MRLLHAQDLTFHEFVGRDKPRYAIISHRWSNGEVSYQNFLRGRESLLNGGSVGYGWMKIAMGCKIALEEGYKWIWIDTICIDKTSSAELTEAINSMYEWYEKSKVCYVFLPDVHRVEESTAHQPGMEIIHVGPNNNISVENAIGQDEEWRNDLTGKRSVQCYMKEFRDSNWFRRAWTLQELLAPEIVHFYNSQFECIGSRDDLGIFISQTTAIPEGYLIKLPGRHCHRLRIVDASVAERMKWASKRQATREEDIAYSLLGIFEVNMPLLYGEGRRAFQRLQMEIIKTSDDESVFVWSPLDVFHPRTGMLAFSVEQFTQPASIEQSRYVPRQHYEMTHKGLRLPMTIPRNRLTRALDRSGNFTVLLPINCVIVVVTASEGKIRYPIALQVDIELGAASTPGSLRYMRGIRREGFFTFRKANGDPSPQSLYYAGDLPESVDSGVWFSDRTGERCSYDLVVGQQVQEEDMVDFSIYIT